MCALKKEVMHLNTKPVVNQLFNNVKSYKQKKNLHWNDRCELNIWKSDQVLNLILPNDNEEIEIQKKINASQQLLVTIL